MRRLLAVGACTVVLASCSSSPESGGHVTGGGSSSVSSAASLPVQLTASKSAIGSKMTLATSAAAQSVVTPDGSWRLTFGAPSSRLTYGGTVYQAPRGEQSMAVSWLFTPNAPSAASGLSPARPMTSISVGGVQVTNNPTTSGTAVVTLPDAGRAGGVVRFDGVDQQVNRDGSRVVNAKAAGFYDGLSNTGTGNCPVIRSNFTGSGGQYTGSCGFGQIVRSPWLDGVGWAGPNQTWVQVTGIINGGSLTWVSPKGSGNVTTQYTTSGALSGGMLAGQQVARVVKQGSSSWVMSFKAPVNTGSLVLNVNEVLSGTRQGDGRGTDAPSSQQVSVAITTPLSFQKAQS